MIIFGGLRMSTSRNIRFSLVILLLTIISFSAVADRTRGGVLFLLIGPGARATGMGEAFVAIADDATATYWNPAGLGNYPLSSKWIEVPMPPGNLMTDIATVKSGLINIDYTAYDVWAASDSGLYLLDGKKWVSGEVYRTAEEQSMMDVIYNYIDPTTYDSTIIDERIIPAVLQANGLEAMPEGFLKPETKVNIPFEALFDGKITSIHGGKRELWVGTDKDLYVRRKNTWERVIDPNGPSGREITVIGIDDRDYIYVGTDRGLYVNKGARWIRMTTAEGLPGNEIHSLFLGSHRDIWVGTDRGPAKMKGDQFENTFRLPVESPGTWREFITSFIPIEEPVKLDVIIAEVMAKNGVMDTDRPAAGSNIEIPYDVLFESPVTSIFVDAENTAWFGTELGLRSFDGQRWEFFGWGTTEIEEEISIKDWAKKMWPKATEELVDKLEYDIRHYNRWNPHSFQPGDVIAYPKSPVSGKITSLERAPDGDLLVGTEYGTLQYEYKKGRFRYYNFGGLKDNELKEIVRHGDEYWFDAGQDVKIYSEGKSGISFMHVKWLPVLADDLYYEYLSGTTYIEGWGTIGGAITYINEGLNIWTGEGGESLGTFHSYELAVAGSYGTRLTEDLAAGLTFKLIHSALAPGVTVGLEQEEGKATTFAVDAGIIYDTPLEGLRLGAAVQNIGPDIHYIDAAQADPLPRNLKMGLAYDAVNTDYNKLTVAADINKDLINVGNDPFGKEFREAIKNIGLEYTYANFISVRGGYMIDYDFIPKSGEDVSSGDYDPSQWRGIHYFTLGAGINFKNFAFDFGYIPVQKDDDEGKLVLSNIIRYSVSVMF